MASPQPSTAELRRRLSEVTISDAARLRRQLDRLRPGADPTAVAGRIERAAQHLANRRAGRPDVTYPAALPITPRVGEIADAIRRHQVVVVAGETGSGKTTQLPKICLELDRGLRGMIGHTQPRRLAARTVAQRIADELGAPLGDAVGYTVRFTDEVSDRTLIKVMTDGILLAEIQHDRRLLRYDTLIIDEAHERSLNVDFLLGYLVQLLPRRPDLKLIITSATIDPGRFAAHFGGAPVVEVSGRTYPVEIRYRAPDPGAGRDQTEQIVDAVAELRAAGDGDILVFLSGEREIRDTADTLRSLDLPRTEVLPLYARLTIADQQKVFAPHTTRRIVLATNVAETSLTVPGVHYVIDPGTARISRYSRRTKVQRLPIEPISQASARQRAGRCGRVADGICIRLYGEDDFARRPVFTEPEILRTNLASVILQMTALGLGDIAQFPFLDPPDRRSIGDGLALLHELGAIDPTQPDPRRRLTAVGRTLAALPIDPRLARMIVQAQQEGCVREVLVLAAALAIPDPRERPADQEQQADARHARFADPHSDFVGYLHLWQYVREQQRELSGNGFRRMCREEFLHYLRIREWQDLRGQLRQIAAGLGLVESETPAEPDRVHAALLAGLLGHVGLRVGQTREYLGARNARFVLSPGSALVRRPPTWVVAAELVETSRLYARTAARIDPETVERLAPHLVVRSYSEPHWERRRGAVVATERVTLFGIPLVAARRVTYSAVNPVVSRDLFIREALVEQDWDTRHRFVADNRRLLAELEELEARTRRRDLVADAETLFAFYDARIPDEVVSARHFDAWWKNARATQPDLLTLTRADVLRADAELDAHPDEWHAGDLTLPITYRFEPGALDDGVTVHVPVDVLARVGGAEFGWQVPALREELVTALIRSLPKATRRAFVPVPDTARAVLAGLTPGAEPLLPALQRELHRLRGVLVPLTAFDLDQVPTHLRVTFAVEDADHQVVATGKDLEALRSKLAGPIRAAVADSVAGSVERTGLTSWPDDLDELPRTVSEVRRGHEVRGFPALVDDRPSVAIRVFATEAEQAQAMPLGTRRLLRLTTSSALRGITGGIGTRSRLVLAANPDGGLAELVDDCADAAVDLLLARLGGPAWTRAEFAHHQEAVAASLRESVRSVLADAERVLAAAAAARAALPGPVPPAQTAAVDDVGRQLDRLLPPGFVAAAGVGRLRDLARYLTGIDRRLARLPRDVELDTALMRQVEQVEQAYADLRAALPPTRAAATDVRDIGWLIEELRVSLFAQQLGTSRPVSVQRVFRAIDAITP
jgi:ATP-dependent helicase HrpA